MRSHIQKTSNQKREDKNNHKKQRYKYKMKNKNKIHRQQHLCTLLHRKKHKKPKQNKQTDTIKEK